MVGGGEFSTSMLTCLLRSLAERSEVAGNTTKSLCALRAAGLLFWQEVSRYVEPYVDLTRSQWRAPPLSFCPTSGESGVVLS